MTRSLLIVLLTMLTGCRGSDQPPRSDETSWRTPPWQQWEPRFSFGAVDSPATHTLGRVRDVAFTNTGRMAILDTHGPRVIVVGPKGDVDFAIEPGPGPGELQDPVALVPLPTGELMVVDRSAYLQFIAPGDDDGIRETERVRLPFRPAAACMLGAQLYVLGFMDGHTLHEVDYRTGRVVRSLPGSLTADSTGRHTAVELTRMAEAAEGRLYCTRTPPRILHAPFSLGYVTSYRPDGSVAWQTQIDGFVEHQRTARAGGVRFDVDPEAGYLNTTRWLAGLGSEAVAVYIDQLWPRGHKQPGDPVTVFLDLEDGREIGRIHVAESIVAAEGAFAATLNVDLVPVVRVWHTRATTNPTP